MAPFFFFIHSFIDALMHMMHVRVQDMHVMHVMHDNHVTIQALMYENLHVNV